MEPEDSAPENETQIEDVVTEVESDASLPVDASTEPAELDDPKAIELSSEYVDRWSSLISTTNWEKGKIIFDWRQALEGSESPSSSYSDEAWSRRVGGVTPQHVGRLRRVYERFGGAYTSYSGLYWSHFWAALDWDDAELWLEGASQSQWSVSQMRRTRWESMGSDPQAEPEQDQVIVVAEDEDYEPLSEVGESTSVQDDTRGVAEGPRPDGPDFGDEEPSGSNSAFDENEDEVLPWEEDDAPSTASPFAELPSLPSDLAEALEQFKLGIIRHRADAWSEVDQADVVRAIQALQVFAEQ